MRDTGPPAFVADEPTDGSSSRSDRTLLQWPPPSSGGPGSNIHQDHIAVPHQSPHEGHTRSECDRRIEELKHSYERLLGEKDLRIEELRKEKDTQIEELKRERDVRLADLMRERDSRIEDIKREKEARIQGVKKDREVAIKNVEEQLERSRREVLRLREENDKLKDENTRLKVQLGQRQQPPPSGLRILLASNAEFPPCNQTGPPACVDSDGVSPVFVGSAIFDDSVHPCKVVPSLHPLCLVPYGGIEVNHHGRYVLLPITPDMEWVPTRNGGIPPGRRPVEGGSESNGEKLYHALGNIDGVDVPGKAGKHLVSGSLTSVCLAFPRDWWDLNIDRGVQEYLLAATSTSSTDTKFCE